MNPLKTDKKENIAAKQRYLEVRKRNLKLSRINVGIIGVALLLKVLGANLENPTLEEVAFHIIWLGIIIFVYTIGSNIIAKMEMNKAK